jgi:hypothetical protein
MIAILLLAINTTHGSAALRAVVTLEEFVPLSNILVKFRPTVPLNIQKLFNELISSLHPAIKARYAPEFEGEPHLTLHVATDTEIGVIARTQMLKKDKNNRIVEALIKLNRPRIVLKRLKRILFHELLHVMGFHAPNYQHYSLFGKEPKPHLLGGFLSEVSYEGGRLFHVMSPSVLEAVKEINPSILGAPLQMMTNAEGLNYPGSHWDKKMFTSLIGRDIMRPSGLSMILTKVTTAFINDFGLYKIDHQLMNNILAAHDAMGY